MRNTGARRIAAGMSGIILLAAVGACGIGSDGRKAPDTATALALASATVRARSPMAVGPNGQSAPAAIMVMGQHAEDIYDLVSAANWAKARSTTDSLRVAVASLPASVPTAERARADVVPTLTALQHAIAAQDRLHALQASNHLTELGARLTAPFAPRVPADVTLLDYYGRELEIWAEARDGAKLRMTAAAIRQTWDRLYQRVVSRGGIAEATSFSALVSQVDAAITVTDYRALAKPLLDQVDKLEAVFTR